MDHELLFDTIVKNPGSTGLELAKLLGTTIGGKIRSSVVYNALPALEYKGLLVMLEDGRIWAYKDINTGKVYCERPFEPREIWSEVT